MSIHSNSQPKNTPFIKPEILLENAFFAPIIQELSQVDATRECAVIDDANFACLAVLRALQNSKTGREFIQNFGIPSLVGLTRSNYFGSLSSKRRLAMMIELDQRLQAEQLPALRQHHDHIQSLTELKDYEIWAADGHAIAHATHDPRNEKGSYTPINAIYKIDLRSHWINFIDLVKHTPRGNEHELNTLKQQDPQTLRCGAKKGQSTILVYDAAIIDFRHSYNIKQTKSIYTLTAWKENLAPMSSIAKDIDRTNPLNEWVISDEILYFNNTPGSWRKITATCPITEEIYITLTNQMTVSPGVLNQLRRLRWNIEKAFNQQEQKLDERKAWTANETGKRIQAIAMTLAHNLIKIFQAKIKTEENIEDVKLVKAYEAELTKKADRAKKAGRVFPKNLYRTLYRPREVSLQFIRWLRCVLSKPTYYNRALEQLRPLMLTYL